ncbi:MAG TPA: PEP-CTERM sorting domain-containing protein [Steroidobacter sp.]
MMCPRRTFGVLAFAFLVSAANAGASPISVTYTDQVTGWEWAEVAELTNLTWNEVNDVCEEDGVTACVGSLNQKEFDGWIWATSDQVGDLFVNATDNLTASMLSNGHAEVFGSPWAPQFLALFAPTLEVPGDSDWVIGWSADSVPDVATRASAPFMRDAFKLCPPCSIFDADSATIKTENDKDDLILGGVWLHRPAETAVVTPEPASLLLLGSGLLVGIRRYRKSRS